MSKSKTIVAVKATKTPTKVTVKSVKKTAVKAEVEAKAVKTTRLWTKSEKKALAKCLKSGMSAVETSMQLDRTVSAVWCMKHQMVSNGEIPSKSFRNHQLPMKPVRRGRPVSKATASKSSKR